MRADPQLGTPSYSEGWGPAVDWADRGLVTQVGVSTAAPYGFFKDVIVVEEYSEDVLNAFQLKYYAPGVGLIRVGWRGEDPSQETLVLVEKVALSPAVLADARAQALKLEQGAYQISKDVYVHTAPIPEAQRFSDVPASHPYSTQITDLADRTVVSGFSDGTFQPESWVSRQQFAKMVVLTLGFTLTGSESSRFTDVGRGMDPTDMFYPDKYVAVCAARGIVEGKTPTTFAPYDNLTRAQLITMVARAANLPEPPVDYLPPFGNFSQDHYPWARKAAHAGLLDGLLGVEAGGYGFWLNASRGEVCAVLYNLLHR